MYHLKIRTGFLLNGVKISFFQTLSKTESIMQIEFSM